MRCDDIQDQISDYIDGALSDPERATVDAHLADCADCRRELAEVRWVTELLHAVPAEPMPEELPSRVFAALAALPDEAPAATPAVATALPADETRAASQVLANAPVAAAPWYKRFNWPSAVAGAVAAGALLFVWNVQNSTLPRIETAVVAPNTDVAVNIGFDVASSVDDVTFQIDLPEGLKFVDDKHQPLLAQSVSWKGTLKEGKTVVPIVVRGVQPGKWTIEAYVRKGPMMRKTTIVMPVSG
jgi:anti-sigma factor ChrR (cupin superfamily)